MTDEQFDLYRRAWRLHAIDRLSLDEVARRLREGGAPVSVPALSKGLAAYASHTRQDPSAKMQLQVRLDQLNSLLGFSVDQVKSIQEEVEKNDGKGLKQVEIVDGTSDRGSHGYTKTKYLRPDQALASHVKTAHDIVKTMAMMEGLMNRESDADKPSEIVVRFDSFTAEDG